MACFNWIKAASIPSKFGISGTTATCKPNSRAAWAVVESMQATIIPARTCERSRSFWANWAARPVSAEELKKVTISISLLKSKSSMTGVSSAWTTSQIVKTSTKAPNAESIPGNSSAAMPDCGIKIFRPLRGYAFANSSTQSWLVALWEIKSGLSWDAPKPRLLPGLTPPVVPGSIGGHHSLSAIRLGRNI